MEEISNAKKAKILLKFAWLPVKIKGGIFVWLENYYQLKFLNT